MAAIKEMIRATEADLSYHRSFGKSHGIESLACGIRLTALKDAMAALQSPETPTPTNVRRWEHGKLSP